MKPTNIYFHVINSKSVMLQIYRFLSFKWLKLFHALNSSHTYTVTCIKLKWDKSFWHIISYIWAKYKALIFFFLNLCTLSFPSPNCLYNSTKLLELNLRQTNLHMVQYFKRDVLQSPVSCIGFYQATLF